jgi:hypothetical protein
LSIVDIGALIEEDGDTDFDLDPDGDLEPDGETDLD